jgi:hypothetical protein
MIESRFSDESELNTVESDRQQSLSSITIGTKAVPHGGAKT